MTESAIVGLIQKLESSAGNTNGKAWVRYAFTINDKKYSTFDPEIGAKFQVGQTVRMVGTQGEKYWDMISMELTEATAEPQTNTTNKVEAPVVKPQDFEKDVKAIFYTEMIELVRMLTGAKKDGND